MKPKNDESQYPILITVFPSEWTLDEVNDYYDYLEELFRTRGPFLTVTDIKSLTGGGASPAHRRLVAQRVDQLAAKGAFMAEHIVLDNTWLRGLVTAYTWIRQTKSHPIEVFKSVEDGVKAAKEFLGR